MRIEYYTANQLRVIISATCKVGHTYKQVSDLNTPARIRVKITTPLYAPKNSELLGGSVTYCDTILFESMSIHAAQDLIMHELPALIGDAATLLTTRTDVYN